MLIDSYDIYNLLLTDKTTGCCIRFATDEYISFGEEYGPEKEIKPELIMNDFIQPRISKPEQTQSDRTRNMAEVFTPCWIVNEQNNLVDEAWFGRKTVFNKPIEKGWKTIKPPIHFTKKKTWQDYVALNRMEAACGEAPYLVTRYDAVSGNEIPLFERVGLLDRKFRIIKENASPEEWETTAITAVKSIYGYDLQGDNVLLARENILLSVFDYYQDFFGKEPDKDFAHRLAEIISWNIFQMNGITFTIPYSEKPADVQIGLFDDLEEDDVQLDIKEEMDACLMDWSADEIITFKSLMKG